MDTILNFFKNKKTRNWGVVTIVLMVVILLVPRLGAPKAKTTADESNQATVVSIQVAESVEASGTLSTQPFAGLTWKTGGVVAQVNVQPGDMVQAGDVLLTLQPASTSASLASAQADLETARANLDALLHPDGTSIGTARENLTTAFRDWKDARVDLMAAFAENSGDGDRNLYNSISNAQDALGNAFYAFPLGANSDAEFYYWAARMAASGASGDFDFQTLQVSLRAKLDTKSAELVDEILKTQADFESLAYKLAPTIDNHVDGLTVMEALGAYEISVDALMDALQTSYETLVAPSETDLASAQAKVDAAQASVNSLKIVAPFAGQVLSVGQGVGDTVSVGTLSVNLADLNHLYVDALVDESDIAAVKVGNPAQVTMDAVPGVVLGGRVVSVNPVGENVSGLIKYTVRVSLDQAGEDFFLPLGTTANVIITVKSASSVLAVPIAAIQNDSNGEFVWVIQSDGSTKRVDVVSGSVVGEQVVVTGDLQAGDKIQLVNSSSFQAPNPFGGGN